MKPLFRYLAAGSLLLSAQLSFAQVKMPAPSPGQTIHQDFALSFVEVNYSRPAMKGRTIMGDLVPYDKVWRTGANNATTITFGDDITFGGTEVKAGKYGLLTIPGKTEWTVILTKSLDVTSPAAYKPENDVVRVKVSSHTLAHPVENFMITFDDITASEAKLLLIWDKTVVAVPLKADVDTKVMAQLDAAMKGDKKPYFQAAYYYLESGKDLSKALEWATAAEAADPKAPWVKLLKGRVQLKSGDKKAAAATAEEGIKLATEIKNPEYIRLHTGLLAETKK